jgi:hypothetical protein
MRVSKSCHKNLQPKELVLINHTSSLKMMKGMQSPNLKESRLELKAPEKEVNLKLIRKFEI